MIFKELILQNFGPYMGRQEIDFSPEVQGELRPIILLGGMNGGGKTTLMDAIRLAFYGQRAQCSTRGNLSYGDFLSQCVNRHSKAAEETIIELAFEHVFNSTQAMFRIRRRWTQKPKGGKDILEISIDKWLDDALTKTWDERIEDILPLGISNLFLFDGEQVKELAELESPPPQVLEAIQSLLGLELAERLAVDLEILVNRKRKEIASKQELSSLEKIEYKLNQKKSEYEIAKQNLSQLQATLERNQEKKQHAHHRFFSEGGKIASESAQLEREIRNLTETREQIRQELRNLAGNYLPLLLINPLLQKAQSQGEKELKQQQAKMAWEVLQERDRKLLNYLQKLSLRKTKLSQIEDFMNQENEVLEQQMKSEEDPWLNLEAEEINQLNHVLNYHLPSQLKTVKEKLEKLQNVEAEIDSLERQLVTAAPPEAYQKLETQLKESQQSLAQAQVDYDLGRRQCEELNLAVQQTKKELEKYSVQTVDRHNSEHIIQSAAKVQETLKQFRERLTLKKLNKLEIEVTECFRYLLRKSNLVHRIVIDSETFRLSLYNIKGQLIPKHRLSAGEKQLLAIAFLWGLARVSGRQLPIAIDTPLGRLDSSHRRNLIERYFPNASHQVILLSTDTEIGGEELELLRQQEAIAQEYLLEYDINEHRTRVKSGYFFE